MSVQLRITPTALQAGDAALVDRAGTPAMVALGSAATQPSAAFATAAQGANSREWTAATVDQAEAEAGAATTRRAWTSQRVRQSVLAWWTAMGAAALRAKAELGTAATQDAGAFAAASHGHAAATPTTAGFMAAADKTKLDGIVAGANAYAHPDHTGDVTSAGDGAATIAPHAVTNPKLAAVPTATIKGRATAGVGAVEDLTAAQVRGLLGVAAGATANATDAELRDRATHVGEQAISTVTGLQTALDGKAASSHVHSAADLASGTIPDARFPAALPAVSGVNLTTLNASNLASGALPPARFNDTSHGTRGGGALHATATSAAAGFMSSTDKTKLDGVAAGATANATDTALRDRATHSGQQSMATVEGLESALAARAVLATSVLVFDAGGNASAPRPAGAAVVMWTNVPSAPVNALQRDLWFAAS